MAKKSTMKKFEDFFEIMPCPVCGSRDVKTQLTLKYGQLKQKKSLNYSLIGVDQDSTFFVEKCIKCKMVYSNPRIKPEHISKVYNECKSGVIFRPKVEFIRKTGSVRVITEAMMRFGILPGMKCFDFGCGFGQTLEFARFLDLEPYGIDIDRDRIDTCKKKGLNVYHPAENPKNLKVDFIIWQNNIEHCIDLHSPMKFLRSISKPGTLLYVNGLPPGVIWTEKRKGEYVKSHFVEHVNYFPMSTLDSFFTDYGFKFESNARTRLANGTITDIFVPNLFRALDGTKLSPISNLFSGFRRFYRFI